MATKPFVKITLQDIEIAEEFFENDKHLSDFLVNVIRYYRQKPTSFKSKIVEKYFKTYKKTMDYVMQAKRSGSKGGSQRAENEANKESTLEGSVKGSLEGTPQANSKEISNNSKEVINNYYLSGGHLSITLEDFNKLAEVYGNETAEEYCHSVLNWAKNSKVKSLYLTALKWLKRDNVKRLGEPEKDLTELEKLEAHKKQARKEAGWD